MVPSLVTLTMGGHLLYHLQQLPLCTARQAGDALVGDKQQERTDVMEALAIPHRTTKIEALHGLG